MGVLPCGWLLPFLFAFAALALAWRSMIYCRSAAVVFRDCCSGEALPRVSFLVSHDVQKWYANEGVAVLRGVLPYQWIQRLLNVSQIVERARKANGRLPVFAAAASAMYSHWPENQVIREFWLESGIAEVVARVVQAQELRLFEDLIVATQASENWYSCWHSDWYSFGNVVESKWSYSVWLPLLDITNETGGSIHLCNRSDLPSNCSLGPGPPIFACEWGQPRDYCQDFLLSSCRVPEFRAGDVVIFAKDSVHRTQDLVDKFFRRYSLIGRFVDGKATYASGRTSFLNSYTYKVMHDMCDHGLQSGNGIVGPCFPSIYPGVNYTEANSDRHYVRPFFIALMAMLEKTWYGGNVAQ